MANNQTSAIFDLDDETFFAPKSPLEDLTPEEEFIIQSALNGVLPDIEDDEIWF